MELKKDIWRPMVVDAPIAQIIRLGGFEDLPCRWLPESPALAFTADPLGLWHEGLLYVFFERFDYRTSHGTIGVHILDAALTLVATHEVMRSPWHLSYPFVFEHDGAIWMMPETERSGAQRLYRARAFPFDWEEVAAFDLPALDATPFRHGDRWWMMHAPAGSARARLTELHVASAPDLLGPWTPHRRSPVFADSRGVRPAGPVFTVDGEMILPVQDCSRSYGSAVRLMVIEQLDDSEVRLRDRGLLTAPLSAAPFIDGIHTLCPAGAVTLIDVKHRSFSPLGLLQRPRRELARLFGARTAK